MRVKEPAAEAESKTSLRLTFLLAARCRPTGDSGEKPRGEFPGYRRTVCARLSLQACSRGYDSRLFGHRQKCRIVGPFHSESAGKPCRTATLRDGSVTTAFAVRSLCRAKARARSATGGAKFTGKSRLRTPKAPRCCLVPFGFPTNLRYLPIPSRVIPAIPTSWGYLYVFILTLDGRDRLGLAFTSSARGYRSPPGSPKRGLRDCFAPRPARAWMRVADSA